MMVKSVLQKIEEEGMDWSEVEFCRGLRQSFEEEEEVEELLCVIWSYLDQIIETPDNLI